jgi:hypothetical protein
VLAEPYAKGFVYPLPHNQLVRLQSAAPVAWLTFAWLDPDMVWHAGKIGNQGDPETFSDETIQFCLTLKVLFGLSLK